MQVNIRIEGYKRSHDIFSNNATTTTTTTAAAAATENVYVACATV